MKNVLLQETTLEPLFADLVRRGLPVDYARRSVDELNDHRADLLAELASEGHASETAEATAMERLGSRRKLARKIAGDFHRRSFAGRWPLFTFLLGPPALLLLAWTATMFALAPVGMVLGILGIADGGEDGVFSIADRIAWHVLWFILMIVVPGLMAVGYTKIVRRSGMHIAWVIPALMMIGLLAENPTFRVNEETQRGLMMVSIPTTSAEWTYIYSKTPKQSLQLLTPISLGIAMLAWGTWERKKMMRLDGGVNGAGPSHQNLH